MIPLAAEVAARSASAKPAERPIRRRTSSIVQFKSEHGQRPSCDSDPELASGRPAGGQARTGIIALLTALFCVSLEVERVDTTLAKRRALVLVDGVKTCCSAQMLPIARCLPSCTVVQLCNAAGALSPPGGPGVYVTGTPHPNAPHHLPAFITAPGDTDTFMVVVGLVLIGAVMMVGNLYLRLHSLPERMAHKSQKLQFEIVAVLGLISLFTHNHLFWIVGLLLAMIDLPDFGTPLRSIAGSVRKIAGDDPMDRTPEAMDGPTKPTTPGQQPDSPPTGAQSHA